jgi:hypothetical protein
MVGGFEGERGVDSVVGCFDRFNLCFCGSGCSVQKLHFIGHFIHPHPPTPESSLKENERRRKWRRMYG